MAQTPGYNANNTSNVARYAPSLLRNRAVTDTYEPGSTFKLVTITAALSEKLVTPKHAVHAALPFQYGPCSQCSVHDAEYRPTVDYSVAQILSYSSNVGAVTIAKKLGPERLAERGCRSSASAR